MRSLHEIAINGLQVREKLDIEGQLSVIVAMTGCNRNRGKYGHWGSPARLT
jgi:hypothetical protein